MLLLADARDLLQALPPSDYLRGKDRQRSLVSVARQHLKKANYRNFNSILEAFRHYDKVCCSLHALTYTQPLYGLK